MPVRRVASAGSDVISGESFAQGLKDKQLDCRELGHKWRPRTASWDRKARCYDRALQCSSCRTVRKQVLDSNGHAMKNSYEYPDGYLAGKGVEVGTLSRDVFRLEAITRFLHIETATKAS